MTEKEIKKKELELANDCIVRIREVSTSDLSLDVRVSLINALLNSYMVKKTILQGQKFTIGGIKNCESEGVLNKYEYKKRAK